MWVANDANPGCPFKTVLPEERSWDFEFLTHFFSKKSLEGMFRKVRCDRRTILLESIMYECECRTADLEFGCVGILMELKQRCTYLKQVVCHLLAQNLAVVGSTLLCSESHPIHVPHILTIEGFGFTPVAFLSLLQQYLGFNDGNDGGNANNFGDGSVLGFNSGNGNNGGDDSVLGFNGGNANNVGECNVPGFNGSNGNNFGDGSILGFNGGNGNNFGDDSVPGFNGGNDNNLGDGSVPRFNGGNGNNFGDDSVPKIKHSFVSIQSKLKLNVYAFFQDQGI